VKATILTGQHVTAITAQSVYVPKSTGSNYFCRFSLLQIAHWQRYM